MESQEPDVGEIRTRLYMLVNEAAVPNVPYNYIPQYQMTIQALSAYLSSYDTQQLVKWNRKLANATVILAFSTFILAIATIALVCIAFLKK